MTPFKKLARRLRLLLTTSDDPEMQCVMVEQLVNWRVADGYRLAVGSLPGIRW